MAVSEEVFNAVGGDGFLAACLEVENHACLRWQDHRSRGRFSDNHGDTGEYMPFRASDVMSELLEQACESDADALSEGWQAFRRVQDAIRSAYLAGDIRPHVVWLRDVEDEMRPDLMWVGTGTLD